MGFSVLLTDDAVHDLEDLYDYVARHDSPWKADALLDRLEGVIAGLTESPDRGSYPKELIVLGIREYRQAFFKPYRVVYRVIGSEVYIMLIADGRRDMQTLLQRRLLEAD